MRIRWVSLNSVGGWSPVQVKQTSCHFRGCLPHPGLLCGLSSSHAFSFHLQFDSFVSDLHFDRWQLRQCHVCSCEGSQRAEGRSEMCCYPPWLYQELYVRTFLLSFWEKGEAVLQTSLQQWQVEYIFFTVPSYSSKECVWDTTSEVSRKDLTRSRNELRPLKAEPLLVSDFSI